MPTSAGNRPHVAYIPDRGRHTMPPARVVHLSFIAIVFLHRDASITATVIPANGTQGLAAGIRLVGGARRCPGNWGSLHPRRPRRNAGVNR